MTSLSKSREFEFVQALTAELSSNELIFPTSLNITMKIRHALNDASASVDKIARIIGTEPVLSAQILRLCNSVAFNQTNQATTDLRKATVRLGFSMVRNVAISVGMKQLSQSAKGAVPKLIDGLWNRSIRVASLSYVMARKLTRLNPDSAMMAGLLHDIGKFYILNRARSYPELFNNEKALWEVVDLWHLNIGSAILESWDVPEDIRIAVLEHLDLERAHAGPPDLTDVVAAANTLDAHFGAGDVSQLDWNRMPRALAALNLDKKNSIELMQDTKQELTMIFQAIA